MGIRYYQILEVLKIDPKNVKYNPKNYHKIERDTAKIEQLTGNKEEAEEIISMLMIGEYSILQYTYY